MKILGTEWEEPDWLLLPARLFFVMDLDPTGEVCRLSIQQKAGSQQNLRGGQLVLASAEPCPECQSLETKPVPALFKSSF